MRTFDSASLSVLKCVQKAPNKFSALKIETIWITQPANSLALDLHGNWIKLVNTFTPIK